MDNVKELNEVSVAGISADGMEVTMELNERLDQKVLQVNICWIRTGS